ncbi:hypothetical protein [Candidatus Endoriftia persephone]|jgi:chromosome segregation ATPase|uniref:Chromosome partition protein Smc n=3 Tax=Gammaproteobacteria TaxID=1236 RepID=G2FBD0_9GAMM|nr:hypothetical protein [Candidatus Endoriftia persephone]EGW56068.1 hypothetical protein TevJSym_aa02120 [endosymbiont of Tevnia jerichonana (vent Tica)]USF88187.1 hypothetical protein L0Y14_02795 [Candidatus Endoriftia persephone]
MMDDGFIDLRLNRHAGEADEGFWPSFTDIMTVIMMIFLLAMVVLLIRNMELLEQLRTSIASEQEAMELVRSTGAENETLEDQLIAREHEISMLRLQLMRMEELQEQQEAAIASQRHQIGDLGREREGLETQLKQLGFERDDLNIRLERQVDLTKLQQAQMARQQTQINQQQSQLEQLLRDIQNLNEDMGRLSSRHSETLTEMENLRSAYADQGKALQQARSSDLLGQQELENLQTKFANLRIKYDRLVRPARTATGKYVVEVRYSKQDGNPLIDLKLPEQSHFRTISNEELEASLDEIKGAKGDKLYIKVIIPKNSGLSYNEAWGFTTRLHRKYDYYFQQEAKQQRIIEDEQPQTE